MPAAPLPKQSAITQVVALLDRYSFDTGRLACAEVAIQWIERYQPAWIRAAAIEALYLGRYKAISVEQILEIWERRGQATPHFNSDFERLICRKLPDHLTNEVDAFLLKQYAEARHAPAATGSAIAETDRMPTPAASEPAIATTTTVSPSEPPIATRPEPAPAVPTAERGTDTAKLTARVVPLAIATPQPFSSTEVFRSPIAIYIPPADASEFYPRLRRFLAQSLRLETPDPEPATSEPANDWVLELGTWQLELDDDADATENAVSETCDST